MRWRGAQRPFWLTVSAASVAFAAVAARAQINAWLFGALLLIAWGLLAYGLSVLRVTKPLRLLVTATALALVVVVWNHTAPQPRIHLDAVRLRTLPSTASPGVVELLVRNSGAVPAHVVAFTVGHLAPLFRNARQLSAGRMESDLSERLERADRLPAVGTLVIQAGETARFDVDIPSSNRSWYIARGEATVLVTARLHYRDRVFRREKVFCLFANPQSGQWLLCPFLNE